MKLTKFRIIWSIITTVLFSTNLYAIDISVSNPAISLDPIAASSTYTISFDINNQSSPAAVTPEDAVFIVAGLSGFNMGNVASVVTQTAGWNCALNTGAVDCDRSFSIGQFSPGTTQTLVITLTSGVAVLNPDTFTILSTEEGGANEDNFADNTTSISTTGAAGPDLDFVDSATPLTYQIVQGVDPLVSLDFQVTNLGANTSNGASFSLFYDGQVFSYNAASSTIPGTWSCFESTGSVDCNAATGIQVGSGTFTDFTIAFNTSGFNGNATAAGGPYTFTSTLFTTGDTNSLNDSISTDVVVSLPAPPDFSAILIDIDGDTFQTSLDFPEGSFTSQTARYQVRNNGGDTPNGAKVSFFYDDTNFNLSNSTTPLGWSCALIAMGQVDCTNSSVIVNGAVFDFFVNFVPSQPLLASAYASLDTFVTDLSGAETNTTDNMISTPVSVVLAVVLDIQFDDVVNTPTYLPISFGDLATQNVPYQIVNNGPDSPSGVEVYLAFDDTKFSLVASTSSPGWNCLAQTFGVFVCDTFNNFPSGSTANFNVQFAALPAATAGLYISAIIADVYPVLGGLKRAPGKPVTKALIGSQIVTDVELIQLPDPDIVVDKAFGNGFFTNTITQAAAGSLVTYKILANAIDPCLGPPAAKSNQSIKGCLPVVPGSNVQISDILPGGLSFDSFNILGPNFNCSESAGTINCTASSLPVTTAEDGVEITLLVTGNVGDIITNTATVTADNDVDINNNSSNPGSFTVTNILPTTLSINKVTIVDGVTVSSVPKGASFKYRVFVKNTGNFNANNLLLVDAMPAGVSINSVFGSGWSCTNSGQQYSCNYPGFLAPGVTNILDFDVTDISTAVVTQLINNVRVGADNAPVVSDFSVTQLTDVSFDLVVRQNPNPIEENKPFEFIVEITNTGTEDILGAEVLNMLPDGFSYSPIAKSTSCAINGPEMLCTVDTPILVGETELINISVQSIQVVDVNATYTNVTTISGGNIQAPISINTVTNVNVTGAGAGGYNYNIFLTSDIVDTVETETPYTYTVNLENTGSLDITFMDVAINLPSDLTILSIMTNGFSCSPTSFGLDCSADPGYNLAPNMNSDIISLEVQSASFTGDVMVDLTSNIGTVLERNTETVTNIVNGTLIADLSVEVLSGVAIDQGDMSEFEVQIVNIGPQEAQNVSVSMAITGILDDVVATPGNDWECQVNSLTIDCQYNNVFMPEGAHSSIFVKANTTRVVIDAEDLVLTATVEANSTDPELSNNTASSSVGVTGTPTEGDIGDALRDALGGSGDGQTGGAIDAVAGYCEIEYFTALEELCDDIYAAALSGDRDAIAKFLKEITPNEVIGQSTSLNEISLAQFRNVGARLNQLRGGGGSGFSSAGLNARYGNGSIPLGMLAYLNQTEEEANSANIDTNNDFISPWGFFVNGTVSMGKRDATGRELGFDFDTYGLTAGLDYRIDSKKVVGIAVGYANFDSTIEGSAELNSTGITLTGYGSFYVNDNFYLDARISLAKPDFEQSRKIDFTLGTTRFNRTAVGDTSSNQYSVSMSGGYSFYKNAWNITPNASFTYTSTNIDSFTESGAGDFNIVYLEQNLESLVWSAGLRVSKAVSLKNGVITPQLDFDYNYQGLNDDSTVEARFINAPIDQMFILQTDTPDRSYGSAGLGLVYISANGKQAYFNYRSILGLEGFSRGTFNVGARFEF